MRVSQRLDESCHKFGKIHSSSIQNTRKSLKRMNIGMVRVIKSKALVLALLGASCAVGTCSRSHVLLALSRIWESPHGERVGGLLSQICKEREVRQIEEREMTLARKCDWELAWLRVGRRRMTRKMLRSTMRRFECIYLEYLSSYGYVLNCVVVFCASV